MWASHYSEYCLQVSQKGFIQSLKFLKKSWNLPSNFPDLEKVWKTEKKPGKKIVKSFFEGYNKCFTSEIFFLLVKSYSILPVHVRLQRIIDKALFLLFLRSLLLTYLITLSLEKEIIALENVWKKSWIFLIQKSVQSLEREIELQMSLSNPNPFHIPSLECCVP